MLIFFIILQIILLIFMLFHDWISVPPFNNVAALRKVDSPGRLVVGSVINGGSVLIPLIITLSYYQKPMPFAASFTIFLFYLCLTIGTVLSWWVPYYFGSSAAHRERFKKFSDTHHFLPARGENVVPNTLHVVLHLQVWACLLLALYFMLVGG